jgi:hypothetical protein
MTIVREDTAVTDEDRNPEDVKALAYELFYWFSRFEFALKEHRHLKKKDVGAKAEADWHGFVAKYHDQYAKTQSADALIAASPKAQFVAHVGFEFKDINFDEEDNDLQKITTLCKTVRNNLFHGGKSGKIYWDDPARMRQLLPLVIKNLNEIAEQTGMWADYKGEY